MMGRPPVAIISGMQQLPPMPASPVMAVPMPILSTQYEWLVDWENLGFNPNNHDWIHSWGVSDASAFPQERLAARAQQGWELVGMTSTALGQLAWTDDHGIVFLGRRDWLYRRPLGL